MPDQAPSTSAEAFRAYVRDWLESHFPLSLQGREDLASLDRTADAPHLQAWRAAMAEVGWAAPSWPSLYGGGGLSAGEALILKEEMARIGAFNPLRFGMGITMVGPTILDYGTEDQKLTHIPRIVRGEVQWCVGYSEPNAGSDLASLQTRAVDAGDHWIINGQKTWTSGGQHSDWCGMLVRTDPKRAKHEGISFLLLDMRQSGVVTKPIPLISGASMFCETFLTDVVAPTGALLGEPNGGWTVGKRLLQHERTSQSGQTRGARPLPRLSDIAKRRLDVDETGRLADGDFRARLVHLEMDAHVQSLTVARTAAEAASGSTAGPHSAASVLKNAATDVLQIRQEMLVELMGYRGLGWAGEPFDPDEVEAVRTWLLGRSASILGGSREIQNNIIAKRILGLPDPVGGT